MRFLLDTHLLLWLASEPGKLSPAMLDLVGQPDNEFNFSAASLWEIVIKNALKRADFSVDARRVRAGLLGNGYRELAITGNHTLALEALPALHKDPFDRILIAQAITEDMVLLTADRQLAAYPGPIRPV